MIPRLLPAILLGLTVSCRAAGDRVLRPGEPGEAGMSRDRLEEVVRVLDVETRSGRVRAASIFVARRGIVVLERGWGKQRPDPSSPQATAETIFPIASITKPMTASALMRLVEAGDVRLDDPVQRHLPEFLGPAREKVRVRDLLTHVSGLPDMLPENVELRRRRAPLAEFVARAMTTPLLFPPGSAFRYQSVGILLAGEIVERRTGKRLPEVLQRTFFAPLGMKDTSLGLAGRPLADTATTQGPATFAPDDPDPHGYQEYWARFGHPWGGAFSTARDVGIFLQMFLNGGVYGGSRVLAPASAKAMITSQNAAAGLTPWGLGWALQGPRAEGGFGDGASEATFGHGGASGALAWADPSRQLVFVLLTSRPFAADDGLLLRRVSSLVAAAAAP